MPTAVPPLPDTARLTSYTAVDEYGPLAVGFDIYGDGDDFENWLAVFVDGIQLTTGFTVSSPSGSFDDIARPITDAVIAFDPSVTGDLVIVGARRPRRLSQLTENRGIPARSFNQIISDLTAVSREMWDERQRTVRAPPGETMDLLPPADVRANKSVFFDADGNLAAGTAVDETVFISAAMQPVVEAATLATARELFGISAAMFPVTNAATLAIATELLLGADPAAAADALFGDDPLRADGKGLWYDSDTGGYVHAYASPKDPVGDLRDFMDMQHGVGGWDYRGYTGGVVDLTPIGSGTDAITALEAALLAVRGRYGYGSVRIITPSGNPFRFTRGVGALYLKGMMIEGVHGASNISQMIFDAESGCAFIFDAGASDGARGFTGGGLRNIQIYLEAGHNASTFSIIQCQGDTLTMPHSLIFENVSTAVYGSSLFYNGFYASGNEIPNLGIRDAKINGLYIFSCRNFGAYFTNIRFWDINQLGTSNGSGTGDNVYIVGGGTTATNSTSCAFRRFYFNGELRISNCLDMELTGRSGQIFADAATTSGCYGTIYAPGLSGSFTSSDVTIVP